MDLSKQAINDYANLMERCQRIEKRMHELEQALKDCVAVMDPEIMALGDYKEHHVMYYEWRDAKQLIALEQCSGV